MRLRSIGLLLASVASLSTVHAAEPARILTNHIGYEAFGPKQAVIQGGGSDRIDTCAIRSFPQRALVFEGKATPQVRVPGWRDWRFWTLEFADLEREGRYTIECRNNGWQGADTVRSLPFKVQKDVLERATISDVVAYFKSQRVTGALGAADSHIPFADSSREPIDAHGGWYDATGDYGVHMSQLDFTSYFNNQQVPLVVYSLGRAFEILEARGEANFNQIKRRLIDEMSYGADFLVRMQRPERSFYQTIDGTGPGKKPEDRRIGPAMTSFDIKKTADERTPQQRDGMYEVSYRSGGGFAIAGLAIAARHGLGGEFSREKYLAAAESAFAFLERNNISLLNDGIENIVDDYCALLAATELLRTTNKPVYVEAARRRAQSLMARLTTSGELRDYWRADAKDRPFFHPSDAGAPVVALVAYHDLADAPMKAQIRDAVKRSLGFELRVTAEVVNPFGLARQYVQSKGRGRRTEFFFPHDTETAPWWQGENARLGSLATAARLAAPLFADDPEFERQLQTYAADQLNWILGLNPFDASMLHGSGRNNPEYGFFGSWQYSNYPGGIVNGITSGLDEADGIDFNLPYEQTKQDIDWRWGEQWLPHSSWYLLAVAAGHTQAVTSPRVVIGYIFSMDRLIDAKSVPAEKLTHINYAFANISNGQMVEGFRNDKANFERLNSLKRRHPDLKVLVSVGGWTWSKVFSDVSLTRESRQRFISSAVDFLKRHDLDGLDIDWEYPGQKGDDNIFRPEDRENFTALLAEARMALDQVGAASGKHYLLTIAAGADDKFLAHTEMGKAAASLDFVNLMTYDQFGPWDATTGHHSPLYVHPANPYLLSATKVVDHFIAAGVPAGKIVLGVPFFGKAWGNVPPVENGLYQPGGPTKEQLQTFYGNLRSDFENRNGYVRYWDDVSGVPYLYNAEKRIFVTYDDVQSVTQKSRYVLDRGLGGIMFWELNGDPRRELLDSIHTEFKH